jgi:enoyl-CoA hydratase
MKYETLLCEIRDGIAVATVNRPDKLNALNSRAKEELQSLIETLGADGSVRAVILTGAGEKSFVAGTDIAELQGLRRETGKAFALGGQRIFDRIEQLGKPVIAAVNGYALGGGCELALACHIRIASEKARFGQPEVLLGIMPGYGGSQRLPRLVGRARALEMMLTGTQIDAAEAFRIGLVNRVVPPDTLMEEARRLAGVIAANAPVAVRAVLEAVNLAQEFNLAAGLAREAGLFGDCCESADFVEGVQAFLEKRKPSFRGQ